MGVIDAAIIKVVSEAEPPITRPEVQLSLFLQRYFARITQSEINGAIRELLKSKRLRSSTGKVSINDEATLTVVQGRTTQKELF